MHCSRWTKQMQCKTSTWPDLSQVVLLPKLSTKASELKDIMNTVALYEICPIWMNDSRSGEGDGGERRPRFRGACRRGRVDTSTPACRSVQTSASLLPSRLIWQPASFWLNCQEASKKYKIYLACWFMTVFNPVVLYTHYNTVVSSPGVWDPPPN